MTDPLPTRTFRLRIAYDGTDLVGWQRQPAGRSVQGALEDALERLARQPVAVTGAGRTDAGVHATGQVASARVATRLGPAALCRALNAILQDDVRVLDVSEAAEGFHARRLARAKTYEYRILNGPVAPPGARRTCWHVTYPLALDAMRQEAAALEGEHDFAAFQSTGSEVASSVRRILASSVRAVPLAELPDAPAVVPSPRLDDGRLVVVGLTGTGFLRHMVRAIAGTLVQVGAGRLPRGTVARLLGTGRLRAEAGVTAPAWGLCLVSVEYDEDAQVATQR